MSSQRFTVSKSQGAPLSSDSLDQEQDQEQGEVNQLFEGDEPPASSPTEPREPGEPAAVVVVLKAIDCKVFTQTN
uniref:Uncharacterized protein n=1 Tax=Knipowitschia caucasica TaxID=637954 RepID=A0AAV2M6W4_KNICA